MRKQEVCLVLAAVAFSMAFLPRPQPQVTIQGVKLGDTRAQVEARWGQPEETWKASAVYKHGLVTYDSSGFVTSVFGNQAELDGKKLTGSIKQIEETLGWADETGPAGVAMCEGVYPGYRYRRYHLTIEDSITNGKTYSLDPHYQFMKLD